MEQQPTDIHSGNEASDEIGASRKRVLEHTETNLPKRAKPLAGDRYQHGLRFQATLPDSQPTGLREATGPWNTDAKPPIDLTSDDDQGQIKQPFGNSHDNHIMPGRNPFPSQPRADFYTPFSTAPACPYPMISTPYHWNTSASTTAPARQFGTGIFGTNDFGGSNSGYTEFGSVNSGPSNFGAPSFGANNPSTTVVQDDDEMQDIISETKQEELKIELRAIRKASGKAHADDQEEDVKGRLRIEELGCKLRALRRKKQASRNGAHRW